MANGILIRKFADRCLARSPQNQRFLSNGKVHLTEVIDLCAHSIARRYWRTAPPIRKRLDSGGERVYWLAERRTQTSALGVCAVWRIRRSASMLEISRALNFRRRPLRSSVPCVYGRECPIIFAFKNAAQNRTLSAGILNGVRSLVRFHCAVSLFPVIRKQCSALPWQCRAVCPYCHIARYCVAESSMCPD